jgi:abhydrolase domain-containing protein 6
MKKTGIFTFSLSVLAAMYYGISNYYKYEIYDVAINFEEGLSELMTKTTSISIGEISYYENKQSMDKPSILLVHGFGAYKENWIRFARSFKDDFHVVIVDLPGHGRSVQGLDLTYTIDNQVKWLNEFVEQLGLKTFHMAGNSMGGAITALYASAYPGHVLTATLINPAGVDDHKAEMQAYIDKGINPLVVKESGDFEKLLDFALEQKPFIPWPITEVSAMRAMALKDVHEKLWVDIRIGIFESFKDHLKNIKAPTLIQWGEQDRVINYKNMAVFGGLMANSTMHLWPNVGHAPMVEIPVGSARLMINHIDKQRQVS